MPRPERGTGDGSTSAAPCAQNLLVHLLHSPVRVGNAGDPAGRQPVQRTIFLWVLLAALGARAAASYRLDSGNTQVSFTVERFGIRWVSAQFHEISGRFVLDPHGRSSHVDVTVAMASVDCSDPRWNERLRSAEWLDTLQYPRMVYQSRVIEMSDGRATALGDLTLRGVTRPVVLDVSFSSCSPGEVCRFTAHGRIKRSDYDLPHGFWTGGDPVEITIRGEVAGDAG
ncbi:MAG TPA: YceI family protein [Steroidobacteraceae bacterium]|nr:YceI family protein [Steroidobacteraceae bacterium]